MYPFERFTERTKKVLTLAHEEATRADHGYIGTEHLLLALLRERAGLAAQALLTLGVDLDQVRGAVEAALDLPEPEQPPVQIIPTARVKTVLELAFEEARGMGHRSVGTEHLLLGLLVEGEGLGARVLGELGITLEGTRAEIERLLQAGRREELQPTAPASRAPGGPRSSPQVADILERARALARSQGAPAVGIDHVEQAIAQWRAAQQ
jgi:ATP-dependent Clp protease ATP-binding subunit ClpC